MSNSSKSFDQRRRAVKSGLCIWCRVNPPEGNSTRCGFCIQKDRERKRRTGHHSQWKPGTRGRPPKI